MTINPLITEKINTLRIPDKVKELMHEILKAENAIKFSSAKRDTSPIYNILGKYVKDEEIIRFCNEDG